MFIAMSHNSCAMYKMMIPLSAATDNPLYIELASVKIGTDHSCNGLRCGKCLGGENSKKRRLDNNTILPCRGSNNIRNCDFISYLDSAKNPLRSFRTVVTLL